MSRKQAIITGLTEARQHILDAVVNLPPDKQDEVFLGIWSIKELLAHLVGWDFTNIEAATDIQAGHRPRVFEQWDSGWVTYNAQLVQKYKHEEFRTLLATIHQSHATLLAFIENLPAEDIDKDYGVRSPSGTNVTLEVFLQYEIEDEERHYQQIQAWLTGDNHHD